MPKVRITPNQTYHPGHVGSLMAQIAPGPMALEQDGSYVVKLTDAQMEEFQRRGGSAHKMEILPESDPPSAVAGTGLEAGPETAEQVHIPTMEEVMAAGYTENAAKVIIRRQELIAAGQAPEDIEATLHQMRIELGMIKEAPKSDEPPAVEDPEVPPEPPAAA